MWNKPRWNWEEIPPDEIIFNQEKTGTSWAPVPDFVHHFWKVVW